MPLFQKSLVLPCLLALPTYLITHTLLFRYMKTRSPLKPIWPDLTLSTIIKLTPWSENVSLENINNYFGFFTTHFLTISMYNLTFFILISKWILVNVTGKTMVNTMRDMEYQVTKTILITCISFVLLNVPTALIMMFDPMPPKGDLPWLHILGK